MFDAFPLFAVGYAGQILCFQVGDVSILINNAGIVTGKSLLDAPDGLMELTMKVNAMAHFWTLKAFLPGPPSLLAILPRCVDSWTGPKRVISRCVLCSQP